METKTFEVRDQGTFIPVLAIKLRPTCEEDRYLFARTGYGTDAETQAEYVIVLRLAGGEGTFACDPYGQNSSTMQQAHAHIEKEFDRLKSGEVIDVEFVRGDVPEPKLSERVTT